MNNKSNIKVRMRTIPKAYEAIKELDPHTDFSIRMFRQLIKSGEIPTIKISNKVLVNLDLLIDKLSCYNDTATCA
ncbi:MAG: hypothetical protein IJ272_02690 [Clostridia bacterium]|nr:hypothetical protein [Clostridia bacterium]